MGISDGLVVLLCVLIAGLVVTAFAAIHQVVTRGTRRDAILPLSNEQEHYMRQVRSRNYAHFFHQPSHDTTVTISTPV